MNLSGFWTLGWLPDLSVVNSGVINIGVHLSFLKRACESHHSRVTWTGATEPYKLSSESHCAVASTALPNVTGSCTHSLSPWQTEHNKSALCSHYIFSVSLTQSLKTHMFISHMYPYTEDNRRPWAVGTERSRQLSQRPTGDRAGDKPELPAGGLSPGI
jgi:hypothetical protein